jgi:hypothetical protein
MPCLRSSQTKERHAAHLQVLPSATPQKGMFQEISHFMNALTQTKKTLARSLRLKQAPAKNKSYNISS